MLAKDTEQGLALITELILDTLEFFNLTNTMSEQQVVQTAILMIEHDIYKRYRPEDFMLCFKRGMQGVYGKVYNRLDGQIFFEWLAIYDRERHDELFLQHQLKKNERIKIAENIAKNPKIQELLKNLEAKKKQVQVKQITEDQKKLVEKKLTPEEQKLQFYIKEFDALYKIQNPYGDKAIRTVNYNDKNYNNEGYCLQRAIEDGIVKLPKKNEDRSTDSKNP